MPILGSIVFPGFIINCGRGNGRSLNSYSNQNIGWEKLNGKIMYLKTVRIGSEDKSWSQNGENICYLNGYVYWYNKDDGNSADEVYLSKSCKLVWKKDKSQSMELVSVSGNRVVTRGPAGLLREWSLTPIKTNVDTNKKETVPNNSNKSGNNYGNNNNKGSYSGCDTCAIICSYSCDTSCSSGCSSSCKGSCYGNCHGECSGYCGSSCGTSCINSCSGNCRSNCQEGCAIACTNYSS